MELGRGPGSLTVRCVSVDRQKPIFWMVRVLGKMQGRMSISQTCPPTSPFPKNKAACGKPCHTRLV